MASVPGFVRTGRQKTGIPVNKYMHVPITAAYDIPVHASDVFRPYIVYLHAHFSRFLTYV